MKSLGMFDPGRVIDSFKLEEILKIHEDPYQQLTDIIQNCVRGKIVEKWLDYWTWIGVPWAVTKDSENTISVWKKNEVDA